MSVNKNEEKKMTVEEAREACKKWMGAQPAIKKLLEKANKEKAKKDNKEQK